MNIHFSTPHQYVFIHEHIKHLLLLWSKEAKKQLFIAEEDGDTLTLTHPGETYEETLWNHLEPFFFRQLETDEGTFPVVLGATFHAQGHLIGMYYRRPPGNPTPFFFRLANEQLHDLPDKEYEEVAKIFLQEFPEYISDIGP